MAYKDDDANEEPSVGVSPEESPDANPRAQAVFIRQEHEVSAMSWDRRLRARAANFFKRDKDAAADEVPTKKDDEEMSSLGGAKKIQYRLEATRRSPRQSWKRTILTCFGLFNCLSPPPQGGGLSVGPNPNQKLAGYLHWMFRVNFVLLFTVMCVAFFGLVVFFAGWITLAGTMDAQCVRIGGEEFGLAKTPFADAFSLSWTTFSTVGYGSTYPGLGYQNNNKTNCFFINFICSLEALAGVLYSGFCGAILFGKILRIQSQAQVIFSDPIVIRYGSGVMDEQAKDEEADLTKIPCPVLEFRIVNRLFNEQGGEIMDASLNVVANIDADDTDPSLRNALTAAASRSSLRPSGHSETESESGSNPESERSGTSSLRLRTIHRSVEILRSMSLRRDNQAVDEDPSARLVSKHIFSKMLIEASDHPFFKRVWVARHALDEHSPLLRPRVRKQIRRNGGYWPDRLNSFTAIRDSLRFNQILVSLNGVSNVSASDVYSQKIYDFVDVNVGYQFVNILYKDTDGAIGVDTDLINDVREQNGGGGEPLIYDE